MELDRSRKEGRNIVFDRKEKEEKRVDRDSCTWKRDLYDCKHDDEWDVETSEQRGEKEEKDGPNSMSERVEEMKLYQGMKSVKGRTW